MAEPRDTSSLAVFQQLLLDALASGDLGQLRQAVARRPELVRELDGYLDELDPDAVELATTLWQKWGKRDSSG